MPNFITDPVLDPYMIQIDENNYAVVKNVTAEKSGKTYQQTLAFCSNLSAAVNKIAKDSLLDVDYSSVREYVEKFEQIEKRIQTLVKL
jgi:hypothetical protein